MVSSAGFYHHNIIISSFVLDMFMFVGYKDYSDLLSILIFNILCYDLDYPTKNHCEILELGFRWTSKVCINHNIDGWCVNYFFVFV